MSLEVVSLILGVLGLIPTVAWYWERRNRKQLELESQRRIWSDISKIRGLMVDMEKDENPDSHGAGRLQAVGKLTVMLRDLIREASLHEKDFSIDTVAKWRAVGKLGSDWQEHLALMLLLTSEIDADKMHPMQEMFSSMDELPDGHPKKASRISKKCSLDGSMAVPGASSRLIEPLDSDRFREPLPSAPAASDAADGDALLADRADEA